MDPFKMLDSGLLRYLVTFFIPGVVVCGPYFYLVKIIRNIPNDQFIKIGAVSVFAFIITSMIIGFVIENLGSLFESLILDNLRRDRAGFQNTWRRYLMQERSSAIVHSYMNYILTRMKFEINVSIALLASLKGLCAIQKYKHFIPENYALWIPYGVIGLSAYLFFEAWLSANNLNRCRRLLLGEN